MKQSTSLIVIGDVHGDSHRLWRAFEEFRSYRVPIVLVGDYIDRGPHSKEVLEILHQETERNPDGVIPLRGNHEEALIRFLDGGPLEDFAAYGGLATIHSYVQTVGDDVPADFRTTFSGRHRDLIEAMRTSYTSDQVFVSHAGFDTENPNSLDSGILLNGDSRVFRHNGPWPRETTVIGHYVQNCHNPLITKNLIALDTGCGSIPGAPLTAVELPGRRIFQF